MSQTLLDQINEFNNLIYSECEVKRWRAESENAGARLELAQHRNRMAFLMSQHEPVAMLQINREHLRLCLDYIQHGDITRLKMDLMKLVD